MRTLILFAAALVSVPSMAATISPRAGEVRVSAGNGFSTINKPVSVEAGAQVMVAPGASASITYQDQCVVEVRPASVFVVQPQSPCATKYAAPSHFGFEDGARFTTPSSNEFGFTPRVATRSASAPKEVSLPAPPPQPTHEASKPIEEDTLAREEPAFWDHNCLIIGGVVLGAGALAAVLLTQNDGPASP